jgi:Zn-dependent protease/CBS domain-containing protein
MTMGRFRLGSILGFEIHIDYSWFLIFVLILWTFTFGVFPGFYPELGPSAYVAMGIVGTLLFFASLLAHELSHAVVARRRGVEVEGITLFIFGGMAHMSAESETPQDEFVIAGVGPLSSFVIGAIFAAIWWVGRTLGWTEAVTGVAWYLALINVVLAVFNLLPGFPLDGGRVFRAIVWRISGDMTKATRVAANGGKWVGYLLMAFGFLQLLAGNLIGGIWMIFIGWFVRTAALGGYAHHLMHDVMKRVRARQAMSPDPDTVGPDLTLQEFVDDYLLARRHQAYPVLADGTPVGVITLGRVKGVARDAWPERRIRDAMVPAEEGILVGPDQPMDEVLEKLRQSELRRVLVVEDGRLVGIITGHDVAGWLERVRQLEGR